MADDLRPKVAIVDFGLGNLFSIVQACEAANLFGFTTSTHRELLDADAVVLPGVGAFKDAMDSLTRLDLISPLLDIVDSGKPLIGICLGLQLLMSESYEFGRHKGLGVIEGEVVSLKSNMINNGFAKVPQIGWNQIFPMTQGSETIEMWEKTLLKNLSYGEFMYFVHSYYAIPANSAVVTSVSEYAGIKFCSSLMHENIFASQFHPERSGEAGLQIYKNLADQLA